MWFYIKPTRSRAHLLPIYLEGSPLWHINHHKHLGMHFDLKFNGMFMLPILNCNKMSYYLYLINYYHQQLPSHILKMLVDTLVFFQLYAPPVWGPSLRLDVTYRLQRLCNCTVQITCGLKKYDHISAAHHTTLDGCHLIP